VIRSPVRALAAIVVWSSGFIGAELGTRAAPPATVLLDGRRLGLGHVAGLVLGSTGVALTAAADLRAGISITALALPLSAMLSLTIGTLLQERWSALARSSTPLMQTLAVQAVLGAGFFTAYAAVAGELAPPPTTPFWIATAWAVLAGIGSYGLYYLITASDGAAHASTLLYLTPATTALWATLMFGLPLRLTAVLGLLVSGVAVVVLNAATSRRSLR
jgi:drug/metabolite transporter (DMT)-like permease